MRPPRYPREKEKGKWQSPPDPDPVRVALYARISTEEQKPDLQLDELREFCSSRGLEITETFVDRGRSGFTIFENRESEWFRMMVEARKGPRFRRFDSIVLWKLDRFGRKASQMLLALDELEAQGVGLIVIRDQIDTTDSGREIPEDRSRGIRADGA